MKCINLFLDVHLYRHFLCAFTYTHLYIFRKLTLKNTRLFITSVKNWTRIDSKMWIPYVKILHLIKEIITFKSNFRTFFI